MPIDPNVLTPTLIKPISVAGVVHDAAVVQEAQARAQAYRDKQMELARDRQENDQIRGILQQSGGQLDDQTFAAIRQVSVPKAMDIEKLHNDSVKSSFEIDNSKIDHDLKVLGYTSRQLAGVTDQHSYDMARAGIKATTGQDLPEQYDPALVQSWQEKGMTYAEKLSQQREDRAAKFQELTATRQQSAEERAAAAQAETARHNQATEANAAANLGVRRQEAAKPAGGAGAAPAPVTIEQMARGSGYTVDGLKKAARAYHESGQLPALGNRAATKIAIQNAEALIYGAEGDMAMTGAGFKANQGALNALTKQLGAVQAYERTSLGNLKQFTDLAKSIPDTGIPWLNTPVRALSSNLVGSANMAAVNAARQVALTEIAKVVSNPNLTGALSDSAREEVLGLIPENATFQQIRRVAQILEADMARRPAAMQKQIADIKYEMSHPGETAAPSTDPLTVVAPNGKTYKFTSPEKAAAFKKAAGIQ